MSAELPSCSTGLSGVEHFSYLSLNNTAAQGQPDLERIPLSQNHACMEAAREKEKEEERKIERTRQFQKRERQAERERQLQARIRHREREMRLQRMHYDQLQRPAGQRNAMHDPYDSSESGYWSIRDTRPKTHTERMWDRMEARERRLLAQKEKEEEDEKKREEDAMFHVMLHGSIDDDCHSDGEYEYKLPAFLKFDEVKKGFEEQMIKENIMKQEREERERQEKEKLSQILSQIQTIKQETIISARKLNTGNKVIVVYGSSDEEDNFAAKEQKAVKWTSRDNTCSSSITSSNCTVPTVSGLATSTKSSIITVHDSDSE